MPGHRDRCARGWQAIRTYSATDVDTVLVVFPELLGADLANVELIDRWNTTTDLAEGDRSVALALPWPGHHRSSTTERDGVEGQSSRR
jgi:hypothetical protein